MGEAKRRVLKTRDAVLVMLVVQTTAVVLLMRYSKTRVVTGRPYVNSAAVLMAEALKLPFCLLMAGRSLGGARELWMLIEGEVLGNMRDTLKCAVPAVAFTVQGNLLFVALSNLDAPSYQVIYQAKTVFTAVFSFFMLGRRLKASQWLATILLCAGGALFSDLRSSASRSSDEGGQSTAVGVAAVLSAAVLSASSSVYFEFMLKKQSTTPAAAAASLWLRNIQLGMFALPLAALTMLVQDGEHVRSYGVLHGFDHVVWTIVLLNGIGGLLVAATMKYADNIVKCFAAALAILSATLLSAMLFDFKLSATFSMGLLCTVLATTLYSWAPDRPAACQVATAVVSTESAGVAGGRALDCLMDGYPAWLLLCFACLATLAAAALAVVLALLVKSWIAHHDIAAAPLWPDGHHHVVILSKAPKCSVDCFIHHPPTNITGARSLVLVKAAHSLSYLSKFRAGLDGFRVFASAQAVPLLIATVGAQCWQPAGAPHFVKLFAIRAAWSLGYEWVLLTDNDMRVNPVHLDAKPRSRSRPPSARSTPSINPAEDPLSLGGLRGLLGSFPAAAELVLQSETPLCSCVLFLRRGAWSEALLHRWWALAVRPPRCCTHHSYDQLALWAVLAEETEGRKGTPRQSQRLELARRIQARLPSRPQIHLTNRPVHHAPCWNARAVPGERALFHHSGHLGWASWNGTGRISCGGSPASRAVISGTTTSLMHAHAHG